MFVYPVNKQKTFSMKIQMNNIDPLCVQFNLNIFYENISYGFNGTFIPDEQIVTFIVPPLNSFIKTFNKDNPECLITITAHSLSNSNNNFFLEIYNDIAELEFEPEIYTETVTQTVNKPQIQLIEVAQNEFEEDQEPEEAYEDYYEDEFYDSQKIVSDKCKHKKQNTTTQTMKTENNPKTQSKTFKRKKQKQLKIS